MIPEELRGRPQWVVAGADKVPIDPDTLHAAAVNNPGTWRDYLTAETARAREPWLMHVGYMLSESDPYTFIDLDEPNTDEQKELHAGLIKAFGDTYQERSQSGKGTHIIVRGSVPRGFRAQRLEVYSDLRYMICTGDVTVDQPIRERQDLLDRLYEEFGAVNTPYQSTQNLPAEPLHSDSTIMQMASSAINAGKFNRLCNGTWTDEYESQSEADFALLSILAFYSEDDRQVARIFRMTVLGQRDKAQRDNYVYGSIARARTESDVLPPPPPPQMTASQGSPPAGSTPPTSIPYPPGLVGDVARYIYQSAVRPVNEVAIVAAFTLIAGIVGRQYGVSGTGLNLYLVLLAQTGSGKEGAVQGINRLMNAVQPIVPMASEYRGPARFASGPALFRALSERPCFFSVLPEYGKLLQELSHARQGSPQASLQAALLEVFGMSGPTDVLQPSVYSDSEKNTVAVQSPSLTILGESNPVTFHGALSETMIAEGFLPRFLVVEYTGDRVLENPQSGFPPDAGLVQRLADLFATVLSMADRTQFVAVAFDPDASKAEKEYDRTTTDRINQAGPGGEVIRQLWNRAHLMALRISGVLAVGVNPYQPVVTLQLWQYAEDLVTGSVLTMLDRFNTGEVGQGDDHRERGLIRVVETYLGEDPRTLTSQGERPDMRDAGVIRHSYLSRRLRRQSAFADHPLGANRAIQITVDEMVRSGYMEKVSRGEMLDRFGTRSLGYALAGG